MKISKDAQAVLLKKNKKEGIIFLLIKRFDKDKQEDYYRLVKGGVKTKETSEQAVKREVFEEVGIKNIFHTEFLTNYGYMGGNVKHEVDVFLVFVKANNIKLSIDSSDEGSFTIKKAIWVDYREAINKLNFEDEKKIIKLTVEKLKMN
ncbi:MAG: NUDIX hydrolase [Candidatus Zambryskibacteria bacterium]|nr:NUDIX hydrolase [Candidatus Zambryskibacteria bacterium]